MPTETEHYEPDHAETPPRTAPNLPWQVRYYRGGVTIAEVLHDVHEYIENRKGPSDVVLIEADNGRLTITFSARPSTRETL